MFRPKAALMPVLVTALLAACGQTPLADAPNEPEAALETAATSPYTVASWYKGYGAKSLISTSQGFCYLTGVQGNFSRLSDQAIIYSDAGKYVLAGTGNVAWASATCLNWLALKLNHNAFTPVRWLSDTFYSNAKSCTSYNTAAWFGDAATFLTGLGGGVDGIGGAYVTQSTSGSKPSTVAAVKCGTDSDDVNARARSMFFGKPHASDMPQFWGPKGQGYVYSVAGNYFATSYGQSKVEMAPTDRAFCYLQGVWGDFEEYGDYAWVYRTKNSAGKEVWKLGVKKANPGSNEGVGAYAACYTLAQN